MKITIETYQEAKDGREYSLCKAYMGGEEVCSFVRYGNRISQYYMHYCWGKSEYAVFGSINSIVKQKYKSLSSCQILKS